MARFERERRLGSCSQRYRSIDREQEMAMNAQAPARERMLARPEQQHQATEATIEFAVTPSWIGLVLVAQRSGGASGVCAVLLGDDEVTLTDELRRRFPDA